MALVQLDRLQLSQGWSVRLVSGGEAPQSLVGRRIDATVPGCVHTDLLEAGLIPDPYLNTNERDLSWIGRCNWEYSTVFDWMEGPHDQVDLVFEGLDTVTSVHLNGAEIGRTQNMHRTYRFEVGSQLRLGANTLDVVFTAPITHITSLEATGGGLPRADASPWPYNLIRKMACNFGWDWGPALVTAGIWRPAYLESWSAARLKVVLPKVRLDSDRGRVDIDIGLDKSADFHEPLTVMASVAGVTVEKQVAANEWSANMVLEASGIDAWWPHTHGEQPLYDLIVRLVTGSSVVDSWARKIGFRNIELDTSPDELGSKFQFRLNGLSTWVRGANWIPDDCFPTRVDAGRYRRRLQQAVDARVNMLRVWGGGIYESDDFYEWCDRMGLMVWQDFLFACAAYPETPAMVTQVEAEAKDNVARLMSHPSLVLWCGNNENQWGYEDWGWKDHLNGHPWGNGYYRDLLPRVAATLDPSRPYWPGSPYSGDDIHPNDPRHGNMHIWDVWNQLDYTHYRSHRPRFVSEFGFQGPPTWSTLRESLPDEDLSVQSPGLVHHQKAIHGMQKLQRSLQAHFPLPADFDDWHFLAQVNQARALELGIAHFRAHRPVCSGSIVWQLNDCWPAISWAVIDSAERPKPSWYALRRAYSDRLLTIQPTEDGLRVSAVNDGLDLWSDDLRLLKVNLEGSTLVDETLQFNVEPADIWSAILPSRLYSLTDPTSEMILATAGAQRAWWFGTADRDIRYPMARISSTVEQAGNELLVTITAETFLRDLCLFVDRIEPVARVDDMLVSLLPGESTRFIVTDGATIDHQALISEPVLRCVNDVPEVVGLNQTATLLS